MRRGAIDPRHVVERCGRRFGPRFAGLCRPHQLGDQFATGKVAAFSWPIGDIVPLAGELSQQLAQGELRMRGIEFLPARLVDFLVEPR